MWRGETLGLHVESERLIERMRAANRGPPSRRRPCRRHCWPFLMSAFHPVHRRWHRLGLPTSRNSRTHQREARSSNPLCSATEQGQKSGRALKRDAIGLNRAVIAALCLRGRQYGERYLWFGASDGRFRLPGVLRSFNGLAGATELLSGTANLVTQGLGRFVWTLARPGARPPQNRPGPSRQRLARRTFREHASLSSAWPELTNGPFL